MSDILGSSWLPWAIAIAIGLPLCLIVLTELHAWLVRAESRMARPVAMLRNFILPSLALLLLLTRASGMDRQVTVVRVVATILAFLLMLFVLSGVNVLLFDKAQPGSWRRRLPSIFIDIGRLVVVAVGLAILFSQVWGADVGGLFAALGVTSIVIGLALQNAVGSVIAGLLLLFEQPFTLGDWLDTGSVRGRVIQVNWRAVHIDSGNGIQIIPNSVLATSSFTNLSQPTLAAQETVEFSFSVDDPPEVVCAVLQDTADRLPLIDPDVSSSAAPVGKGTYAVTLHLTNLTDSGASRPQLQHWVWYASRRAGLHLDGTEPANWATPERLSDAVRTLATSLMLPQEEADNLAPHAHLLRFGSGEIIQKAGTYPTHLALIIDGQAALSAVPGVGASERLSTIETNGYINPNALTREPSSVTVTASTEVTTVELPVEIVEDLVRGKPALARDLSAEIDRRRNLLAPSDAETGSR